MRTDACPETAIEPVLTADEPTPDRRTRLIDGLRRLALVLLGGAIVGVSSERIFWYWTANPLAHIEIAAFYAIAVGATIWVISRYRVNNLASLVLAAPIFAYVVEGVITPVLYSGGPFVPFFPVWFTFWHGFFGIVGLWYFLHRWLIAGRWRPIALASAAMGLFWGLWSTTMLLPENLEDRELEGPVELLDQIAFTRYAFTFTAILAAAHWLWGRLRTPTEFVTSKWTNRIFVLLIGAVLVAYTVAIPWALPMFVAYVALQVWLLRRHAAVARGPGLLQQLEGPVKARHLLALAPMPVVAAVSYGIAWQLDPPFGLVRGFMFTTIGVQTLIALVVLVRVSRKTLRAAKQRPDSPVAAESRLEPA